MPTYEYQCTACHHQLEAFQDISENPLTDCPACHKPSLEKLISAASFQLKGTGWYVTDFKNKTQPQAGKSGNDSSSGSSSIDKEKN